MIRKIAETFIMLSAVNLTVFMVSFSLYILFENGCKLSALSLTAVLASLGVIYLVLRLIYGYGKEVK